MNNPATLEQTIGSDQPAMADDVPKIPQEIGKVLEIVKVSKSSLTPKEINAHLAQLVHSYDELTALYARNNLQIETELAQIKAAGGATSLQIHQIDADLRRQASSLEVLAASTSAEISSVQGELQRGLANATERASIDLAELSTRVGQDVSRLTSDVQGLANLFDMQEHIVREQSARLDQFDAAREILDTAVRGNRQRIEAVREELEKQHAVLSAQVQGLAALQREHYGEFGEVRKQVGMLDLESLRLDKALSALSSEVSTHILTTRRSFKRMGLATAAVALLALGGVALIKWTPAFAPESTKTELSRTQADVSAIREQLNALPALQYLVHAQEADIGQANRNVATLKDNISDLKRTMRALRGEIGHIAGGDVDAAAGIFNTQWVLHQDPKTYAVQLLGTESRADMLAIVGQMTSTEDAKLAYTVTQRDGRERYNLFYGVFANVQEARAAMDGLPLELRARRPWVRNLRSIQNAVE